MTDDRSGRDRIKRNVLLISYHFPPSKAVGGMRAAGFARNLEKFNYNAYVLTINSRYLDEIDSERLRGIKVENIYRTRTLPSSRDLYLKAKSLFLSIIGGKAAKPDEPARLHPNSPSNFKANNSILTRVKRNLAAMLTGVPDPERNWIIPAVVKGLSLIKAKKIDCIITSSPPHSVHLIGFLLKILSGVKWVVDFRDPWYSGIVKRWFNNGTFAIKCDRWLEQRVICKADTVLTNSLTSRDILAAAYRERSDDVFVYLANGYDPELCSKFACCKKYEKFTLTYAGTLYGDRNPEPIFKALKELELEGRIVLDELKINLVGNCGLVNGEPIGRLLDSYNMQSVVDVIGPVSHNEALKMIKKSHIALLLAPDQPLQVPAKIYDYMGLGTKILAITGDGATKDLIRSTHTGGTFNSSDIDGVKNFILDEMAANENNSDRMSNRKLKKYEQNHISQKLARKLDQIIEA